MTEIMEPGIAIIVICIAQLRPLVRTILPQSWRSSPARLLDGCPEVPTFGQGDRRRLPKNDLEFTINGSFMHRSFIQLEEVRRDKEIEA